MVVSSLEGYTLFKGITGVYFYSFESIITLSLSLFYLTKLIFMKIVRFKTVGGKIISHDFLIVDGSYAYLF